MYRKLTDSRKQSYYLLSFVIVIGFNRNIAVVHRCGSPSRNTIHVLLEFDWRK